MKIFNWVSNFLMSLSIVVVVCITAAQMVCFDNDWYHEEFKKHNVYETVNMEKAELNRVSEKMIAYLQGAEEEIQVSAIVDGKTREFFNEKEIQHMADVKVLFDKLLFARNVALCVFMITGIYYLFARRVGMQMLDYMPVCFGIIGIIMLLALVVGFMLMTFNFTGMFTKFHELLFTNDLWILDPSTSLLINILPEGFFEDSAMKIGKYFGIIALASVFLFPILSYMKRNYEECSAEAKANMEKAKAKDRGKIYVDM